MPRYYIQFENKELGFDVKETAEGIRVQSLSDGEGLGARNVDFAPVHFTPTTGEGLFSLIIDGLSYQLYLEPSSTGYRVAISRHRFAVTVLSEREWRLQKVAPKSAMPGGKMVIAAPMPGLVKAVLITQGEAVVSGQRLVVLEAMKMENDINASREGRVSTVHVQPGNVVEGGRPLVTLE